MNNSNLTILRRAAIRSLRRVTLPSWLFTSTISGPRFGLRAGRL